MDTRTDGWANDFSLMGSVRDKSTGLTFKRRRRLSQTVLEALYEQNSIAARVVDRIVDDAFREGWELTDLDVEVDLPELYSRLEDLNLDGAVAQAAKWSRLYGASLLTIPTDDPDPLISPLLTPSTIRPLSVVTIRDLAARPLSTDVAFGSPTYRQTLSYEISGLTKAPVEVHHSRVVRFEPIVLPMEALLAQGHYWGPSVLDRLYDDLSREGAARTHANSMMFIASLLYVKLKELRKERATEEGRKRIRDGLRDLRDSLDALGLLGLDAEDEIGANQISLTNVHELIDKARDALAAAADMPREILFNESPAGLNAGELSGPQEIWFAKVAAFQKEVLTPAINRVLEVAFRAWGIPATKWAIKWRPLWTKSDKSTAEVAKMNAETDQIYHLMGAADAEEIRHHRFEQGKVGPLEVDEQPTTNAAPLDFSSLAPADVEAYTNALKPSDTALAGPQIAELVSIIEKVQVGSLPRDSAIAVIGLAFPQYAAQAEALLGSAGIVAPPTENEPGPSTEAAPGDLMSPQDAAAKYGVPTVAITKLIRESRLPYWGIGAHKRVSEADVARLAKQHEAYAEAA